MVETNTTNPDLIARRTREQAIIAAEENYRKDVQAAVKAREDARRDAEAAKSEAVKQVKAALEKPRIRLSEARDRIETRLRKQELDKVRYEQEKILINAETARLKSLKQADMLGKRLNAEAAEARRQAIRQAYENEKAMKQEAAQLLKNKKTAWIEDESQAGQNSVKEAGQALKTPKLTERVMRENEHKAKQKAEKEASKALKEAERTRIENERIAKQRAEKEAAEAAYRANKSDAAARVAQEALDKTREKIKAADKVTAKTAKTPDEPELSGKPSVKQDIPKTPTESVKPVTPGPAVNRTGMIKLTIADQDAGYGYVSGFENRVRAIPDIRVVLLGGTSKEGIQIIVSSEKPVMLADLLRQLPMVEDVIDNPSNILVKLKPVAK